MLLSSVIMVLQETLEAALLVSVLLTVSNQQWGRSAWLIGGICGGMVLSFIFAFYMVDISEWFDYVGQEVVISALQIAAALLVVACTWAVYSDRQIGAHKALLQNSPFAAVFIYCAAAAVALAITREGSEIFLYLNGFLKQEEYFQTVMVGSSIGFSIGLSIGVLFYYGLSSLPGKWWLESSMVLMAMFAGNMFAQAVLQLNQADWISSTRTFWDTSDWLPENSILGHLLYSLIGYESSPSAAQLIAYSIGVILVLAFRAAGKHSKTNKSTTSKLTR